MNNHRVDDTLEAGAPLGSARSAILLIHGRGSSAQDMARLAGALAAPPDTAFLLPNATGSTWYPQRFLAPLEANEPWLSGAIGVLDELVRRAGRKGIAPERVALLGFSQGACLALEYSLRHPGRFWFVAGLSGALIGPLGLPRNPANLEGTPILVAAAAQDAHIPVEHVEESARVLASSGADVTKLVFPGQAHAIFPEEIDWIRKRLRG